jgi:hypothetical protein
VAPATDGWHRPRVRQAQLLTPLKPPEQHSPFNSSHRRQWPRSEPLHEAKPAAGPRMSSPNMSGYACRRAAARKPVSEAIRRLSAGMSRRARERRDRSGESQLSEVLCRVGIAILLIQRDPGYRSDGFSPVCFARRASIRGPISSASRKANTTSGQPCRASTLCDPVCRFTFHPIL